MPDVYVYLPGEPIPGPTLVVSDDINIDRGADLQPVGVEVLSAVRVEVDGRDVLAERDEALVLLRELVEHWDDERASLAAVTHDTAQPEGIRLGLRMRDLEARARAVVDAAGKGSHDPLGS